MFSIRRSDWSSYERAIPRKNLNITSATRICSLHFQPECISLSSSDSNPRRATGQRKKPRLVPGSIPTLFPNCPRYLSSAPIVKRSLTTSIEARRGYIPEPEIEVLDLLEKEEKLGSLNDVFKMSWKGCSFRFEDETFFLFIHNDEETQILGSLTIGSDLSFSAKLLGFPIALREFGHILVNKTKLTYKTELDNCIAHLKNMVLKEVSPYKEALRLLGGMNSDDEFIEFVKEQLLLKDASPNKRQYSPKLYSLAFFWRSASTHCYKILQQLFVLPSISTINRLSSNVPSSAQVGPPMQTSE